jgi:hypothetical protein
MAQAKATPIALSPSDICTADEIAARLRVTKSWVYDQMRPSRRRKKNPLPVIRLGGPNGRLRFHWPSVSAWFLAQQAGVCA